MRSSHGGNNVEITTTTVKKLIITDVPNLDPVHVFLEDIGPRQGKVTINCYNQSWVSYWGGMGERNIAQFLLSCNEHYIAKNLSPGLDHSVVELGDDFVNHLRRRIIKDRRARDCDKEYARELWDRAEEVSGVEHQQTLFDCHGRLLDDILGDEWWYRLPEVPNPQYVYLCRIINTVKAALQETKQGE
jgi:hypothetical protein